MKVSLKWLTIIVIICNENVTYPKNYIPLCKSCGFYLIEGNKTDGEIKKVREERTTYCHRCKEMVYSVPIDLIIEKMEYKVNRDSARVKDDMRRVKQEQKNKRISGNFWDYLLVVSIPFFIISIMVFGIWGWLLIIAVGVILYFDFVNKRGLKKNRLKIREDTIKELNEDLERSTAEFKKTQKEFQNICRKCFKGVNPNQKAPV